MPPKMPALRRSSALTRAERKEFGPVQIGVVGFDDLKFQGDILPELRRLRDLEIVRLVGMVIIAKSHSGELVRVKASDLTEEQSVISNDSDLRLPSQHARNRVPVGTVNPAGGLHAGDLRGRTGDGVGNH